MVAAALVGWLPLVVTIPIIVALWAAGSGTVYERPTLAAALYLVFALPTSGLVAVLLARSFLNHGAAKLLLVGMGAVFWACAGTAGSMAGINRGQADFTNTLLTIHNVGMWCSALCHLAGATLTGQWRVPQRNPRVWLAVGYGLALTTMVLLVLATSAGQLPAFFVPGQGATLVRKLVLVSTAAMLGVTGILFAMQRTNTPQSFTYWYGQALLFFAAGVLALVLSVPGTMLGWTGRIVLAIGSVCMLIGVLKSVRQRMGEELVPEARISEGGLGYAVAVAVVSAAAAVRVLLLAALEESNPFITFYPALAFAALYGGWRAGALATVLSTLVATYFWIEPVGQFAVEHYSDWMGIAVFPIGGVLIAWMADRMRTAEAQARQAEAAVLVQRDRLDEQVRERTAELVEAQQAARLGHWRWDPVTDQVEVSEEILAIFGRSSLPHGRAQAGSLYPLQSWQKLKAAAREALGSGAPFDLELQARRGDGSEIWIEIRGGAVRGPGGKVVGLRGTMQDISQRKLAEEALAESQRRLTIALEAGGATVWEIGGDSRNIHGSENLAIFLGYAPDKLRTVPDWLALIHEDERADLDGIIQDTIEGRCEAFQFEWRIQARDGGWHWFHCQEKAVDRDASGLARRLIGAYTNIDVRKRTEESLRLERSRLQAIIDNSPLLILVKDMESRVVLANKAIFDNLLVPPREKLVGHSLFEAFPPNVAESRWLNDLAAMGQDAPVRAEERIRHRDETWHTYETVRFPVRDIETNELIGICAISTDITERKAVEAQIQHLNADLERRVEERTAELARSNEALLHSNMELQHFARATAHDLQTPLRSIAGFAQLLQREVVDADNERINEYSSLVISNTKRLQTLIENLLAYTRLDAQGLPFEAVDLQDITDEVIASLGVLIEETGAQVSFGPLPRISVDRLQIAQVFQNLIENGIKYNRSKAPKVSISAAFQQDRWLFSVNDNGMGIDPKHQERIFEVFRRLHTYHQVAGTGIGLALCRRIVERHGGRIWVESQLGEGSTFYFTLPVRN